MVFSSPMKLCNLSVLWTIIPTTLQKGWFWVCNCYDNGYSVGSSSTIYVTYFADKCVKMKLLIDIYSILCRI